MILFIFLFFRHKQQFTLGITSLSKLGPIGAAIEVLIILYLCVASLVGFYTMPFMNSIRPQRLKTSLSQLIVNCALVLILGSALPLLSRILGKKKSIHFTFQHSTEKFPYSINQFNFFSFSLICRHHKFRFAGRFWWNRMVGQFPNCFHIQFDICHSDHIVHCE